MFNAAKLFAAFYSESKETTENEVDPNPSEDSISEISFLTAPEPDRASVQSVVCRHCYEAGDQDMLITPCKCSAGDQDMLITPCKCSGTTAFVHVDCLERWINQSKHRNCDVCQTPYPLGFKWRPLKEWQWVPICHYRVYICFLFVMTALMLLIGTLHGVLQTVLDENVTLNAVPFGLTCGWMIIEVILSIALIVWARKYVVAGWRVWVDQKRLFFIKDATTPTPV